MLYVAEYPEEVLTPRNLARDMKVYQCSSPTEKIQIIQSVGVGVVVGLGAVTGGLIVAVLVGTLAAAAKFIELQSCAAVISEAAALANSPTKVTFSSVIENLKK
jgi:hypothetical protein